MYVIKCINHPDRPFLSAIMPNADEPLLVFTSDPGKALGFWSEDCCKMFIAALNFTYDECYPFSFQII